MKLIGGALRLYCFACGLIVTPVAVALVSAHYLGVLPDRIQRVFAKVEDTASGEEPGVGRGAVSTEGTPVRADKLGWRLWERRLEQMGDRILTDVNDLGTERKELEEWDGRLRKLSESVAPLVSLLLDDELSPQEVLSDAPQWTARLEARQSQEESLPRLIETLSTVEPKSLAVILSGGEQQGSGLEEDQAVRLISKLEPRRSGEVLSELAKIEPALAARIIARLGGQARPSRKSED